MFPDGADIEFIEHFWRRVGVEKANRIMKSMNSRLLDKSKVNGIHGTLFIQLVKQKKHLYPNKRFSDDPATKH